MVESYKVIVKRVTADYYTWQVVKNNVYVITKGAAVSRKTANAAADKYLESLLGSFDFR